jgi:O-antigen/teichoic acid export membrane protein
MVGSEEYGLYFSLFNFSLLFNILLDLGINNFNSRSISQDPSVLQNFFSNIVAIRLLLALLYGCLAFSVAFSFGYNNRQLLLLLVLLFNQFLASFILYLRSNISGLQFYVTDSLLSVLDRSIAIILCSLVIWGNIFHRPFEVEWFVYLQTMSYLLAIVAIVIVVFAKAGPLPFAFQPKLALDIIRQSLPFALLIFLMTIYNRVDSVMLERLLTDGAKQAGIYAQSYRLLDAASMFAFLFASLLLPMFSRMLGLREDVIPLLKLSFSLLFVFSIAFSFSCSVFSKPIIGMLYNEGGDFSASVFSIIVLCFIPNSVTYIFGTLLTANGSLRMLNYTAVAAVFLNIILNLWLIPLHKAYGAAMASLATQLLVATAQVWISFKVLNLQIKLKSIAKYLGFIGFSMLAALLLSMLNLPWLARFVILPVIISVIALLFGILPIQQFFIVIKQQKSRLSS